MVDALVILVILAVLGGAGWYIYRSKKKPAENALAVRTAVPAPEAAVAAAATAVENDNRACAARPQSGRLAEVKEVFKTSKPHPSAYRDTVGGGLRSKSKRFA